MKIAARGTITLTNGQKRVAEYVVGSLTGKLLLRYKTPAGNWRNPLPSEAATFVGESILTTLAG